MNQDETEQLREYVHTHDLSAEMDDGSWEADLYPNPMVSTSLRLPKDVLDWVRTQAADAGVKPTALIRQWIEQRRAADETGPAAVEYRIQTLEAAVLAFGATVETPDAALAEALRRVSESIPAQVAHRGAPAER